LVIGYSFVDQNANVPAHTVFYNAPIFWIIPMEQQLINSEPKRLIATDHHVAFLAALSIDQQLLPLCLDKFCSEFSIVLHLEARDGQPQ
jgi:hypothetical protein